MSEQSTTTSGSFASGNDDPNDENYEPTQSEEDNEAHFDNRDDSPVATRIDTTPTKSSSKHLSDDNANILLQICLNEFNNIRSTETGQGPGSSINLKKKQLEVAEAWERIQTQFQEQTKVCDKYCIFATHNIIFQIQKIL